VNTIYRNSKKTNLLFLAFIFTIYANSFSQANYPYSVQVNSTTNGHQDSPEIAVNDVGTVVVVYESGANGPDENIFAVSYDRETFREFYHTGPTTDTASLEALPDSSRFVVAWEQNNNVHFAIISCIDENETFLREPAPALPDYQSFGKRPDVAISPDGSLFVIGWYHGNNVMMQFFDAQGQAIGSPMNVADVLVDKQRQISLGFRQDSTLIAVWHAEKRGSFGFTSKDEDIWFQIFDCKPVWHGEAPIKMLDIQRRANGDLSVEGPVQYDQEYPEVDVFDDGRFVIMWQDFPYSGGGNGTDGSGKGAYFRIFNYDGTPQTDDIQMSEHTYSFQKDADIRIRQSDQTIHFIYEDAYQAPLDRDWLAFPSYRPFDDQGDPLSSSLELSDKSYGTDCRIAITEADAQVPNLILAVWETKDIENYDGSGRAVIFRDISAETSVEQTALTNTPIPEKFQLYQNYPNPFNSETTIIYSLHKTCRVHLGLFNLMGKQVAELVDGLEQAGEHKVRFHAGNLASGIYLVKMSVEDQSKSVKVIHVK